MYIGLYVYIHCMLPCQLLCKTASWIKPVLSRKTCMYMYIFPWQWITSSCVPYLTMLISSIQIYKLYVQCTVYLLCSSSRYWMFFSRWSRVVGLVVVDHHSEHSDHLCSMNYNIMVALISLGNFMLVLCWINGYVCYFDPAEYQHPNSDLQLYFFCDHHSWTLNI